MLFGYAVKLEVMGFFKVICNHIHLGLFIPIWFISKY